MTTTDTLRLLNWNVRGKNYRPQTEIGESLLRVAGGPDFDCVVLTEVPRSDEARLEIRNCFEGHGWSVTVSPSTSAFGIAIASRESRLEMVASADTPNITYLVVKATFGSQSVLILGVRVKTGQPDDAAEDFRTRAEGIESLSKEIAQLQIDHPGLMMIGAGDFNHARIIGSEDIRDHKEIARLYYGKDQAPVAYQRIADILNRRHGLVLHTPASGSSIGALKIDHVFAPQGVPVTTTYRQDYWGSDHRPQFATVRLADSGHHGE